MSRTIADLRKEGRALLREHFGDEYSAIGLDCDLLISEAMNIRVDVISAYRDTEVSDSEYEIFVDFITRRTRHEPVAYITGRKEFYGREFLCSPEALIPRPDTEIIVDRVREFAHGLAHPFTILDVGCGTGCIGLTLAAELRGNTGLQKVFLSDIAIESIALAQRNAKKHNLSELTSFLCADALYSCSRLPDIVVSNPPYISEFEQLMPDVGLYEPKRALFAGNDGMDLLRILIGSWMAKANSGQRLYLEIGASQQLAVESCARQFDCQNFEFFQDLSGLTRVVEFVR